MSVMAFYLRVMALVSVIANISMILAQLMKSVVVIPVNIILVVFTPFR